jgi:DNA-binding transcriptional MerR regulator
MASQASRKRAYEPPTIPDRLYFKIGDVAQLCGVETYVLRFWESQFPQLKPNKSGTGQRLYRRRDVEMALEIKRLVHAEGYTLAGARTVLEQGTRRHGTKLNPQAAPNAQAALPLATDENKRMDKVTATIGHARAELRELAGMLGSRVPQQPPRRRSRLAPIRAVSGSLFPP